MCDRSRRTPDARAVFTKLRCLDLIRIDARTVFATKLAARFAHSSPERLLVVTCTPDPTAARCVRAEVRGVSERSPRAAHERDLEMKISLLRKMFEEFKDNAGPGLLASDIWAVATAQPIIGYNTQPAASALFNRIAGYINKALNDAGFPPVSRYFLIDLADDKVAVVVYLSPEYRWGMLCDTSSLEVGLLLHVIIPQAMSRFQEALGD